ncbi:hypothetical protein O3M35_009429 [Rhynocoris fuscipes]|uniref:Elongator complex protein 5 n=1 Tax=Rhynocoris fuscipes TaxID=488301 RepID=A0AAW1D2V9_9HEMI
MILKQLLKGRHHSDFIVIKDNLNISASKLLKLFIENNLNRGNEVTFLMYENSTYNFTQLFASNKNFKAINCFDDPWNWLGEKESNKFEEISKNVESFQSNSLNVIVIDSFAYLLHQMDIRSLCLGFKAILDSNSETRRSQIITVLHSHCLPDESPEFKQINSIAKTVITLDYDERSSLSIASVEHRKSSGKISFEEYKCSLDDDGNFKFDIYKNKPKDSVTSEINPMDLTTFKLSLEDHEKETRSRVVLPYVKTEDKPSKIFYVPDANDDWDEEDPDDDLEI